ncbi:MAG: hypothetical protein DI598_10210 [Pseudopedobacter saltans]|uniref:Uncharacterized protein n=1 Tax=Pseudopedobacter saltans TaxID=151895 RepID=A0A2W5H2P6_9SPHI|nr:MAG: hypothetical protein DI598_10210 [Pseudopedobacter saltans]
MSENINERISDRMKEIERQRQMDRKGFVLFRTVRDFTMATLILAMAFLLLIGEHIPKTRKLVLSVDPLMRYMFGGLCLIYGSFRLYRAIKKDY